MYLSISKKNKERKEGGEKLPLINGYALEIVFNFPFRWLVR